MNDEAAIRVEEVTKTFRVQRSGIRTLKTAVLDALSQRSSLRLFNALQDISFHVRKGETLGIIGANGAGKSTLLSLIAGTMTPSRGSVHTAGSISSLLELGAGFHPDLSGRENVYLYGAVMGVPRRHIEARFQHIVDFAGLADFIDQPVKHYSSGMYVRLGFSVAVEVDPDILLIDEVLAVGDIDFQRKCLEKIGDFRKRHKTMLIISHDLHTIQSISDRILFLSGGRVAGLGTPAQIVGNYEAESRAQRSAAFGREWGTGEVRITEVTFRDADGHPCTSFPWGGAMRAQIDYEATRRVDNPVFGFAVSTDGGATVYGNNTQIEGFPVPWIEGKGSLNLRLDPMTMSAGTYLLSFSIHSADHRVNYHRLDHRFPIQIVGSKPFEGCYMPCRWSRPGDDGPAGEGGR